MVDFAHFIITKFNLKVHYSYGGNRVYNKIDPTSDIDYLNGRMDIFEKYTYPSVINQSNQNFHWIVLFSDKTPEVIKNRINKSNAGNHFVALFLSDEESANLHDTLLQYIATFGCDNVITTRLDNDDVIHIDFVKEVQEAVLRAESKDKGFFISFKFGLQYEVKGNSLRRYEFPNNHFLSLWTPNKQGNLIYDFNHTTIQKVIEPIYIDYGKSKRYMWLEVCHATNVSNTMGTLNPKDFISKCNLKDDYNIDVQVNHSRAKLIFFYLKYSVLKLWRKKYKLFGIH